MDTTDTRHTPRSLRARLDMSIEQLVQKSGVSRRAIQDLEDGKDVSLKTVRSIASALDVTREVLIAAIDVEQARRTEHQPKSRRRAKGAA